MRQIKSIFIKESQSELNKTLKTASPIFVSRIRMLIEQLRHSETGISKRELAKLIGVNPNSIQKWRATYEKEGLDGLLKHGKIGFKPSVVIKEEHASLQLILNDPENGLQGYKELKRWFEKKHSKIIPYITLENPKRQWKMNQLKLSKAYTTNLSEIITTS